MVGLDLKFQVTFSSIKEFYIYYISQHMKRGTRRCHLAGSLLAVGCVVLSILRGLDMSYLVAAPILGYGISWAGDVLVEGITPTSFRHPMWSFVANMKMLSMMISGEESI